MTSEVCMHRAVIFLHGSLQLAGFQYCQISGRSHRIYQTGTCQLYNWSSHRDAWWSPALLKMAGHLPADGKQWMNSLFRFACSCESFALPIKLSLCQPTSFLTFTLLILSPVPLKGEWVSSCVGLSCLRGLNHDTLSARLTVHGQYTWSTLLVQTCSSLL